MLDNNKITLDAETIELKASKEINTNSDGTTKIQSKGQIDMKSSGGDVVINGSLVKINC